MNAAARQKTILLVDDDRSVRTLEAQILVGAGYVVVEAVDGAEGWAALERETFDLVITDHKMPKVTGLELIMMLRGKGMTLPVILVTGTLPTTEIEEKPWLRLDGLLTKPFAVKDFLEAVERVLTETERAAPEPRILVVDDDSRLRELNVGFLIEAGYRAEGAKDGAAGWAALQAKGYDLVITDNKMPNMTGLELIEKVRAARIAIPVIMATGVLPTLELERRPWLKPQAMLQQPFSNDLFLKTIEKVLRGETEA